MENKDGRTATKPYRVRVGGVWYWVDPTVPQIAMEPRDVVVVYPVSGDPVLAILQGDIKSLAKPGEGARMLAIRLASLEGEHFEMAPEDIAALHLTAVDEVQ